MCALWVRLGIRVFIWWCYYNDLTVRHHNGLAVAAAVYRKLHIVAVIIAFRCTALMQGIGLALYKPFD